MSLRRRVLRRYRTRRGNKLIHKMAAKLRFVLAAAFLHYAITAILPFEGSRPASPRATFVGQLSPVCAARQKHHSHAATPVSRKQFPLQGLCSFFPLREASWTCNPLAFSNSVLTLNPWSGRHHAQLHRACSPLTTRRVATNGILGSRAESDSANDSNVFLFYNMQDPRTRLEE